MSSLPRYRRALLLVLLPFLLLAGVGVLAAEPRPFEARYHLEVDGWPNATIEHRLSRDGTQWLSDMRADITLAQGRERSRFLAGEAVRSLHYASGYSLLGVGKRYALDHEALARLPDRQAALFELSRRATAAECTAPCRLRYLDHRGRETLVEYRLLPRTALSLPAGNFEAVRVEVIEPDEPDRQLRFSFHPGVPGLLLAMEYHRDGERRSRLSLSELDLPPR
ncbi:hypothetical protein RSO68_09120 [Halomonas saccharevitans]|uniref:DUF3108 domain-containing protein n=1 Tax=Halomonas saccharevitans TaxID=416872 RepID=A0ABU3NEM1_9GAMM|nr:hypothetical protein [Halomonas saccharevitans]MDT8879631.1 hypothetical protein [Halomonas saccharevitans]